MKIYNLGIEKTGTTSIAGIFKNYNSVHEFEFENTISKIYNWKNNIISRNEFVQYINNREENRNSAFVDSSSYNHYFADIILEKFPNAKFIFTIREARSWFISDINMIYRLYNIFSQTYRRKYFDIRTDGDILFSLEASKKGLPLGIDKHFTTILLNTNLIEDSLQYYYSSIKKIKDLIPKEKLLILNTENISNSINELSNFSEINVNELLLNNSRENQRVTKKQYFNCLDNNDINKKFNKINSKYKK
jgi:hypothetical protein